MARRPNLQNVDFRAALAGKTALAAARRDVKTGGQALLEAWLEAGWQVARRQWRDPQISQHFLKERGGHGENLSASLLLRVAEGLSREGKDPEVLEVCQFLEELEKDPTAASPSPSQHAALLSHKAASNEMLAGACDELARQSHNGTESAKISRMANEYRRQSIRAYEDLVDLFPDDEILKTKLALHKNALK